VLVTTDTDLLAEASKRQRDGTSFAGVVFYHQQTLAWGEIIADLELFAVASTSEEVKNHVFYLPL
jgi:hypothetical protein